MSEPYTQDFDVIVIGSGITGGWAAKEFCERGFKTLVLERGRNIEHGGPEYRDAEAPWDMPNRDLVPESYEEQGRYTMLRRKGWPYKYTDIQFFVDEKEYPYSFPPERPFMWTRGYQLGGRSLTWGRQTYRWGPRDFEANKRDGHGVDWPIRYQDLAPWYDHVERFIGVSGRDDKLDGLPSSVFQKPWEMSCAERFVAANLARTMPDRPMIMSRCAHLTEPTPEQLALGRGPCQARNHCMRGCSYGAYFSSLSGTLPAARNTGNLTVVTHAIVDSIIHDATKNRVSGVRTIDEKTSARRTYTGKLVFVCAGSIASVQILLNSRSAAFPNGLANSSDMLGRRIMDHLGATGATGKVPGFGDRFAYGRRPTAAFIPNYRHDIKDGADFVRGFAFEIAAPEPVRPALHDRPGIGVAAKTALAEHGDWLISIHLQGEMLPYDDNRATLHPTKKDRWGIPLIHLDCWHRDNEHKMQRQAAIDAVDILNAGGCVDVAAEIFPEDQGVVGLRTHEMGGAGMGRNPRTSVLNGWNQAHDIANLFVTDGACMSSTAAQNPSLTYMAITARAVDHASKLLKSGII